MNRNKGRKIKKRSRPTSDLDVVRNRRTHDVVDEIPTAGTSRPVAVWSSWSGDTMSGGLSGMAE